MANEQPAGMYQRLGRYELLGEIASGGMATVYLGRALGAKGFSRLVAIKRLHPHLEKEEDFVAMFLDEARLAARIRHPNVVPTLDVDDQEGLYIVMEYIEGDRLLGLLRYEAKRSEKMPPGIAMTIAVETLSGLHAAHDLVDDDGNALNLVHRDVSPQNVLIGIDGVTKITDFGIAKAESRLAVTRDGQLKGKLAYMAPEQTRRTNIDRRVDVFAMGILTWEMLTGRRLFRGDSDVEILNAVVNEPIPRLREAAPEVPAEIDAVVMKALERSADGRYATAAAFAEALELAAPAVGGLASSRVVAQYVLKVAGPKLEEERARIKSGLTLGGQRQQEESSHSRPSGPRASASNVRSSRAGETSGDVLPATATLTMAPTPAPRNRAALPALLVGVAVVAATGGWLATRRGDNDRVATSAASTSGRAGPGDPEPTRPPTPPVADAARLSANGTPDAAVANALAVDASSGTVTNPPTNVATPPVRPRSPRPGHTRPNGGNGTAPPPNPYSNPYRSTP